MTDARRSDRPRGPDFLCIGPTNSATTWISDQFKFQRDIWMHPIQELSFLTTGLRPFLNTPLLELHWDIPSIIKRVVRNRSLSARRDRDFLRHANAAAQRPDAEFDRDSYFELFRPAGRLISGDITPMYASMDVTTIRRVSPWLAKARIFTVIRDPVDRFWGALARHFRYATLGEETDYGSIETVRRFFHDPVRSGQHLPTDIVDRWNEGLGHGQLKIFYFDDIRRDSRAMLESILDYIGSDIRRRLPFVPIDLNRKRDSARPNVTHEAREWVRQAFQDELGRCAERFGEHGKAWQAKHAQPIPPDPPGTVHVRSPTSYRHPLA